MPKNPRLVEFALQVIPLLGEFGPDYLTPLRAFLSMSVNPGNDERLSLVRARGLTSDGLIHQLQEILANDTMLAKCCGNAEALAYALDLLFFGPLPDCFYHGPKTSLGFDLAPNLHRELDALEEKLYEKGEFTRTAYFHLYNVRVTRSLDSIFPGWQVQELRYDTVSNLFHPAAYKEYLQAYPSSAFAITQDTTGFDVEDLEKWLRRKHVEALLFRRILQLTQDGTMDIDYVVPYFCPAWVNTVQGGGVFHIGSARKDAPPSTLYYLLTGAESDDLAIIWDLIQQYSINSTESHSSLQKAISIALDFYEESHSKSSRIERFANLIIALEALYTPTDKSEVTLRLCQCCAVLLGGQDESSHEIYKFLKEMFVRRGKLFHGKYGINSQSPESFINDEDLKRLFSVVRRSIVSFIRLYLNGERHLDQLRRQLEDSILNEEQRETVRERSQSLKTKSV
jgi:Apea-like HEPN